MKDRFVSQNNVFWRISTEFLETILEISEALSSFTATLYVIEYITEITYGLDFDDISFNDRCGYNFLSGDIIPIFQFLPA